MSHVIVKVSTYESCYIFGHLHSLVSFLYIPLLSPLFRVLCLLVLSCFLTSQGIIDYTEKEASAQHLDRQIYCGGLA